MGKLDDLRVAWSEVQHSVAMDGSASGGAADRWEKAEADDGRTDVKSRYRGEIASKIRVPVERAASE